MIKKTLCFSNPAYLSLRDAQLVIKLPEVEKAANLTADFKKSAEVTRSIEDIGVVVLDHKQITITQGALEALLENNSAVITCDSNHMPVGLLLPLVGNTTQNERFRDQLDASLPLRKQLWQQTMQQKTLDLIGRRHTVSQVKDAFYMARELGFDNINMDFIVGLPNETYEDVKDSMEQVLLMKPESVTIHSLAIKRTSRLNINKKEYEDVMLKNNEAIMLIITCRFAQINYYTIIDSEEMKNRKHRKYSQYCCRAKRCNC